MEHLLAYLTHYCSNPNCEPSLMQAANANNASPHKVASKGDQQARGTRRHASECTNVSRQDQNQQQKLTQERE